MPKKSEWGEIASKIEANNRVILENQDLPLGERLATLRRLHPLPPATGLIADKAFSNDLCEGECDFTLTDIERA